MPTLISQAVSFDHSNLAESGATPKASCQAAASRFDCNQPIVRTKKAGRMDQSNAEPDRPPCIRPARSLWPRPFRPMLTQGRSETV